jgi:lipoprotein-anchoring transpeptidase ErfK/SrfK
MRSMTMLAAALLVTACGTGDDDSGQNSRTVPDDGRVATAFASGSDRMSVQELEAARLNMDWREFVERDTTAGAAGDTTASGAASTSDESWDDITAESVNSGAVSLPLSGDVQGPSVLRVQILLDQVRFSPGIIDGRWGSNTEKAVYWLQKREGLPATGHVDSRTWERLVELAAESSELVRTVTLSADDVSGPFVTLPEEYYDRRDMDCQCFESLAEKLAETYHTSEDLLGKLNPDVDLNAVQAGQQLNVPHVSSGGGAQSRPSQASGGAAAQDTSAARQGQTGGTGTVARIVISDGGRYLHAMDASGRILYHFPATLGSDYSPSPTGDYSITNIAHDPTWHYQPDLLEGVDDDEPDAVLPPGPNNAVGVVWMQLSRPHYGIHGTSAPETIGYATSNGCVRLTNWDAEFLSHRVEPGTTVEFRDVR